MECSEVNKIIKIVTSGFDIDMTTEIKRMRTFRNIEKAHWAYLDNYTGHERLSFSQFMKRLWKINRLEWDNQNFSSWKSEYNSYKKSIPTAGAIIYTENSDIIKSEMVVVKNNCSRCSKDTNCPHKIFSLPKGKKDDCDNTLLDTAVREVKEETGLDIKDAYSEYLSGSSRESEVSDIEQEPEPNHVFLCKSKIYEIPVHHKIPLKTQNPHEIVDLCWAKLSDIVNEPHRYSRQVRQACDTLLKKYSTELYQRYNLHSFSGNNVSISVM